MPRPNAAGGHLPAGTGAALCVALLLLLVLAAGCASVPGPESKPLQTASPTPSVTMQAKGTPAPALSPARTLITRAPVVQTSMPATTAPSAPAPATGYSAKTCSASGGHVAGPGEQCPGTWIDATDTSSCCSVAPAPSVRGNVTVTARPLDLRITFADDPGPAVP